MLVPLLLVYTAILYAYALKIGLAGTLPKGTLGSMVVGYLLTGAATLLLAYPIRESGGLLVRLFWRYWVWLALMPVLLLFLAAYTCIAAYGLTEPRYIVVLIGNWALLLAILRIWRPDRFDLRLIPGTLAALLLAASFGPWGAIGASVISQKAELAAILRAKGLLADGKIRQTCRKRRRLTAREPPPAAPAASNNINPDALGDSPWFEGVKPPVRRRADPGRVFASPAHTFLLCRKSCRSAAAR